MTRNDLAEFIVSTAEGIAAARAVYDARRVDGARQIERERVGEYAKARAIALFDSRSEAAADIIGEVFGAWAAHAAWEHYRVGPEPKTWTPDEMAARLEALEVR